VPEVEASFGQISFYHSPPGLQYRADIQARPVTDEHQHATARTPLRATFDEDLSESEREDLSGSDEERTLHRHGLEDHEDLDNLRYRPCNGTGVLCSVSDLSTAFPNPSTPISSNTPPTVGNPNQNNNNRSTRDFITLDLNQFNAANNSRPPPLDDRTRSTTDLITGDRATATPKDLKPLHNGPRGDTGSSIGLSSIAFSPTGDTGVKLSNGIGPSPPKVESSQVPSPTVPTLGMNGFLVNKKLSPVKEKTKTTPF
jgi:hypothetical protein